MFAVPESSASSRRLGRRGFLQVGALGLGGLTLPNLLRLQARGESRSRRQKSVIMVYLHGGPPHMDMFDMKPEAPAEIRGEFSPVRTNVPGLEICELMPKLATVADKMAVIRNMSFREYLVGHNAPLVYTGYPTSDVSPNTDANPNRRPTFGSVVSKMRGDAVRDVPPYVAFDGIYNGGSSVDFLGMAHRPFVPGAQLNSLGPLKDMAPDRMTERKGLLRSLDMLQHANDAHGSLAGMDSFQTRALDIVTSPKARDAFDISQEPEHVRSMYGAGGTQFLQARRLVEAGVQAVTLTANKESETWYLAGPWDTHGNNFKTLRKLLPDLDQCLFALITDLSQRGMLDDVAVVVWGEMGRTPKINNGAGRDHWNEVGFGLVSGGGLTMGQVIGRTTRGAERSVGTPYRPSNLLATLYANVLGIDPALTYPNFAGRPLYVLDERTKIRELL